MLHTQAVLCVAVVGAIAVSHAQSPEPMDPKLATTREGTSRLWYEISHLTIEGRGWQDTAHPYDRLPARAQGAVTDGVWHLSKNSAGMAVRFVTDATSIEAQWTLRSKSLAMNHMPATGVSGLDLYIRTDDPDQPWHWVGIGRPEKAPTNEKPLVSGLPEGWHEFRLYLPLYNGIESVELGIEPGFSISPGPAYPADGARPIVFYGTSITQGGCASRPGMAYPAIIGRWLDRPTINLGFSGSGKMEIEMAELLGEVDASAYVLDCLPNMSPELVTERVGPFVRLLREARPETPVVLVENIRYQAAPILPGTKRSYTAKNDALRAVHDELLAEGVKGLHYVPGENLLGDDGEATVDGSHATDVGFLRMAEVLTPVLRSILEREPQ
jgi:hypothetical protein